MINKSDNDYQAMMKIIRREIGYGIKQLTGGSSNVDFINNYGSGGGSTAFGNGSSGIGGSLRAYAFGNVQADPGTATEVTRRRLIGAGIVFLVDDSTGDQIQIQVAPINTPLFYIGF